VANLDNSSWASLYSDFTSKKIMGAGILFLKQNTCPYLFLKGFE
jgi:hypothetical protein